MRKITLSLPAFLIFITYSSCTSSTAQSENVNDLDSRLLGVWQYDAPHDKDQSMAGLTVRLSKVASTNEAYYFNFMGNPFMFSKKDDSTLIGVDNRYNLYYNANTGRLVLDSFHDAHNEFWKPK